MLLSRVFQATDAWVFFLLTSLHTVVMLFSSLKYASRLTAAQFRAHYLFLTMAIINASPFRGNPFRGVYLRKFFTIDVRQVKRQPTLEAAHVELFSLFDIDHGEKDAGPSCGTPVGRVFCLQYTTDSVKIRPHLWPLL